MARFSGALQKTKRDVRLCQAYRWAGYHRQSHFFRHFAGLLAKSKLEAEQLVDGAVVFGAAAEYQEAFFQAAEPPLLEALPRCPRGIIKGSAEVDTT